MTTNVILRKAIDVRKKNEIANFDELGIYDQPASAISIELINYRSFDNKSKFLTNIISRVFQNEKKIFFFISLNGQPDNRIIRYKKGWGLIKSRGNFELVENKEELMKENNGKLDFLLLGEVCVNDIFSINEILNLGETVFFLIKKNKFELDAEKKFVNDVTDPNSWIKHNIVLGNTIVFFLDSYFDESSCEVVFMSNDQSILTLDKSDFL